MRKRDLAILMLAAFAIFFSLQVCGQICKTLFKTLEANSSPFFVMLMNFIFYLSSLFSGCSRLVIGCWLIKCSTRVISPSKRRGSIYRMSIQLSTRVIVSRRQLWPIWTEMGKRRSSWLRTMQKFRYNRVVFIKY